MAASSFREKQGLLISLSYGDRGLSKSRSLVHSFGSIPTQCFSTSDRSRTASSPQMSDIGNSIQV